MSNRLQIAAGNWKMNTTLLEAKALIDQLTKVKTQNVKTIIAAPFTHLAILQAQIRDSKIDFNIAAQDCHHELKGAYTGEISTAMLKSINIEYVIIGHSERRAYNQETNTLLKLKLDKAIDQGLKVIFCCGEPLEIRKNGTQIKYVIDQLKASLFHLSPAQLDNVIIAYEPIWAIGTGETASPEQAQEMHSAIRKAITANINEKTAAQISILYGGSVKPANAKEIFSQIDVDGGLVGGASLKYESFSQIMKSFPR